MSIFHYLVGFFVHFTSMFGSQYEGEYKYGLPHGQGTRFDRKNGIKCIKLYSITHYQGYDVFLPHYT